MRVLFFDDQRSKIDEYTRSFAGFAGSALVEFTACDVRDLMQQHPDVSAIVSPANCFGVMDGGIDIFYMQLFPGIQLRVQKRIESFGITTHLGRSILPVGSAINVETDGGVTIVCVPTMFLPEDIRGTENVYWATRGLLNLLHLAQSTGVVAVPCMGTGCGKLTASESASQVRRAFDDYLASESTDVIAATPNEYVLSRMACPQPITYANMEFQPETMAQFIAAQESKYGTKHE